MTLTEFLLQRIAEDETVAKELIGEDARTPDVSGPWIDDEYASLVVGPGRVLAECEAKRAVIDAAWGDHCRIEGEWGMCQSQDELDAKGDVPDVVKHLASIYADHADYPHPPRA